MSIPYCIPIRCDKRETVLKVIEENSHLFRYFEVWLGTIENLDDGFPGHLVRLFGESLVILFRKVNLEIPMPEARRQILLEEMSGADAYIDLDITAQINDIKFVNSEKLKLKTILSYHNYDHTPSHSELKKHLEVMENGGASVYKFATMCNSPEEAIRLLQLGLELKAQKKEYIVLGMGPYGAITRIFGTLWGNKMVFAPRESAHASAPGQLTRDQLETVLRTLGYNS